MYIPRGMALANQTKAVSQTSIGDLKESFQASDHDGWILLNGRAKAGLTATQQAAATSLTWGANIPDARDKVTVGATAAKLLGTTGGSYSIMQSNLPNVQLLGSTTYTPTGTNTATGMAGRATLQSSRSPAGVWVSTSASNAWVPSSDGHVWATPTDMIQTFTGTLATISISNIRLNGNVAQTEFTQPYLAVNKFVYLGA